MHCFTMPRVSCSQYGNRTPAHDSLNCFYTLLALPQTLACALWRSTPGLRRCGPAKVYNMHDTEHNLASFIASTKHMWIQTTAVVLLLYSTELTTGFLLTCTSVCGVLRSYILIITHGHSHRLIGVPGWERTTSKPASPTVFTPQFLTLTGFESVWRGFEVGQMVS